MTPRMVHCVKSGRQAEGLDHPPYPGELGKRIWESVSKDAWQDWLRHQTMLVNENRLNLADERSRDYLKRQMENHFFGSGAERAAGYVPPHNDRGRDHDRVPPHNDRDRGHDRDHDHDHRHR